MFVLFDIGAIAFLLAIVLTPFIRDAARSFGFVDHPDGSRKLHLRPVPRVGGVAIAASYLLAFGVLLVLPYGRLPFDVSSATSAALRLVPAAAIIFLTGLWDDLRGLKPWQKLAGQALAATVAFVMGFGIHSFRGFELDPWMGLLVTIVWLVGCANAVNLIDGMDGLAAGVGLFASITTLVAALLQNNVMLAIATAPLVGSLVGFLRYNFNPASVFMGDCGSLLIGFLLGCFGAVWGQKSATVIGMTAPLMALAIPLLDTGLAMARRAMRRQPIMAGDSRHIHHRLLARGLNPRRVVLLLYALCGMAAAFSLVQETAQNRVGGLILILFCAFTWLGIQHLGYSEFGVAKRLVFKGTFRGIIDVESRLIELEDALKNTRELPETWALLRRASRDLGFSGMCATLDAGRLEHFRSGADVANDWQLRVPLTDGQYLDLYRAGTATMHPVALASFAQLAARYLIAAEQKHPRLVVVNTRPDEDPRDRPLMGRERADVCEKHPQVEQA
jgi:UDP-GlcNAc:undecaprenyl-phosphate GlcNAc-1-phosphate transferase